MPLLFVSAHNYVAMLNTLRMKGRDRVVFFSVFTRGNSKNINKFTDSDHKSEQIPQRGVTPKVPKECIFDDNKYINPIKFQKQNECSYQIVVNRSVHTEPAGGARVKSEHHQSHQDTLPNHFLAY